MVGASKILTVSYGTFSCTLEGFDDSFSTMKAIAEYFRDLAADDRYFGAEPPTPDADMLARIAEREIERRVDARFDGENVVLRAAEAAPAALPSDVEAPQEAEAPVAETQVETPEAPAEEIAPEVEPEPRTESETEFATDTVEDRAVNEPAPAVIETPSVEANIDTDPVGDDAIAAFMSDDMTDETDEIAEPVAPPAASVTEIGHPDADRIAAKLQRIRAVVAPGDDNDDSIFVEDQHAEAMHETDTPVAQDASDDNDEIEETIAFDPVIEDEADEATDDLDMTALMSSLATDDTPVEDDAPQEDTVLEDVAEVEPTEEETLAAETETLEVEAEDDAPAGRVFKVKSAALEAALADDADTIEDEAFDAVLVDDADPVDAVLERSDEAEENDDTSIFEDADGESDLSPEEEAELLAELAEVARDTDEDDATQDRDGAAILASLDDPEPAIDRIMEKTNDALETPESGRKRDAISHLKAAVAATEADRKLRGGEADDTDETESYRDDLAQVVRPKRATPAASDRVRPARPTSPLKLVAEQRVDTSETAADATPVRPRRISKTAAPTSEAEGGFAEFAQNAGAQELPDLLEAAAAYTAYVEGRENFTRPQVMRRAAAVAGKEGFSREDGLRSFGQLLREGKINKLSRGQFVVSEETRFRPNARIAGE